MYAYAYEALPTRNHTKVANLKLSYVAIGNDGTSQAEGIVFSLRSVRDNNAIEPGILEAHEMHHQLRTTSHNYDKTDPADDNLLGAFYNALNEGTARPYRQSADPSLCFRLGIHPLVAAETRAGRYSENRLHYSRAGGGRARHAREILPPAYQRHQRPPARLLHGVRHRAAPATANSCSTTPMTRWPSQCCTRRLLKKVSQPRASRLLQSATSSNWCTNMPSPGDRRTQRGREKAAPVINRFVLTKKAA